MNSSSSAKSVPPPKKRKPDDPPAEEEKKEENDKVMILDRKFEETVLNSKEVQSFINRFVKEMTNNVNSVHSFKYKVRDLEVRKQNGQIPSSISSKIDLHLPKSASYDTFINEYKDKKRQYEIDLLDIMLKSANEQLSELQTKVTSLKTSFDEDIENYIVALQDKLIINNDLFKSNVSLPYADLKRKIIDKATTRLNTAILTSSMKDLEIKRKQEHENKVVIMEKEELENKSSEQKIGSLIKEQLSSELKKMNKKINDKLKNIEDKSSKKKSQKNSKPSSRSNSRSSSPARASSSHAPSKKPARKPSSNKPRSKKSDTSVKRSSNSSSSKKRYQKKNSNKGRNRDKNSNSNKKSSPSSKN